MDESDESIVLRVQTGDHEAYGEIIKRYEHKLARYGSRFIGSHDVRTDIVQDVFVKAYMNLQSFKTNERFSPWIYRIAHNSFVNEIRRASRYSLLDTILDTDTLLPHLTAPETADQDALAREEVLAMETQLNALKPAEREIIILYYFEELSYDAISDVLKIPTSAVGVKLHRAKRKLKNLYQKNHHD